MQVILKEGGDLSALTGLLGYSVAAMRLLPEQEGGGICLSLALREMRDSNVFDPPSRPQLTGGTRKEKTGEIEREKESCSSAPVRS